MDFQSHECDPNQRVSSLQDKLLLELWTVCHEPAYMARNEFFVLAGNGQLVRVERGSRGEQASTKTLIEAADWLISSLPDMSTLLPLAQQVGGIVADYSVALRLRRLTSQILKVQNDDKYSYR